MTVVIVTVCEAHADFRTATGLADRVVCERAEWIEPAIVEDYRTYRGLAAGESFVCWSHLKAAAQEAGIRAHGHFDGQPGAPDAVAARKALLLIVRVVPGADAVLLIRDDDRQESRRRGLEQARNEHHGPPHVVIGLAHCKREAWVLAGFVAENHTEQARSATLRQELGFDPCTAAQRLTAVHDQDKLSAKRALTALTGGDADREACCWAKTSIQTMRDRGAATGLAAYIGELENILLPLFAGPGNPC